MNSSTELFKNMKKGDIPEWKPDVPFYDQEPSTIQFWLEEKRKIQEGINVGGYFIHPWLYFHINFYKTLIPTENGDDIITTPPLDDNFLYVIETHKEAEEKGLGIGLFGARGVAKTTILTSKALWTSVKTDFGGRFDISGGSSSDLLDIYNATELSLGHLEPAISLPILRADSKEGFTFGLHQKTGKPFTRGSISIKNLVSGQKSKSEKGAGGTPIGAIVDEIGKFDPRGYLDSALPSFTSQYGARFVHLLAGTGGNNELSEGAKHILENPAAYNLLPINFERLERNVPESAITWRADHGRKFCTFFPAQMSYRLSCRKEEKTLKEYLDPKGEEGLTKELDDIKIFTTNWEAATEEIQKNIESKSTQEQKNRETMYYPTKIDDCFLTESDNPFPVERCMLIKRKLEEEENWRAGMFERGLTDSGIDFRLSKKPEIAGRKYENKPIDSPYLIYENIPEETPPDNYYVSGLDDYALAQASESDSLGAFYIIRRRNVDINTPIEQIVASLATRPKLHPSFHDSLELGITKYNAICNMESANTEFVSYFENTQKDPTDYLSESFSPATELLTKKGGKNKLTSRFGVYPTPQNTAYIINQVIQYANSKVIIGTDENGRAIEKMGVDFIPDPLLHQEMIDYSSKGGNYDRIVAFGHALVYSRRLDKYNILPEDRAQELKHDSYKKRSAPVRMTNHRNLKRGRVRLRNF